MSNIKENSKKAQLKQEENSKRTYEIFPFLHYEILEIPGKGRRGGGGQFCLEITWEDGSLKTVKEVPQLRVRIQTGLPLSRMQITHH